MPGHGRDLPPRPVTAEIAAVEQDRLKLGVRARLARCTWPELEALAAHLLIAVPLGATEQHGPHLPLGTDIQVAGSLVDMLAGVRGDIAIAPPLCYGSSGEHAGFPGTLSIGQAALEAVAVELARSADAFRGVVFVSAHGGNAEPLGRAAETLRAEGRKAMAWSPTVPGGDAHAGRTETSLLLSIMPEMVRTEAMEPGVVTPLAELLPELRRTGVRAVSPNGVLGDPAGASAAEGGAILDQLIDDLAAAVAAEFD